MNIFTINPVRAAFTLLLSSIGVTAFAQFTPNNIVALQVGDGTETLANTGNSIRLREFTPAGVAGITVAIPKAGTNALVMHGTSTAEGFMSRSGDGLSLLIAGYNSAPTTGSISATTAAATPRAIGKVDISGTYSLAVNSNTAFNTNNIRGAAGNGTDYWASGGNTGIAYFGAGTAATVSTTVTNTRALSVQNGQLYFSTASGTTRGVYAVGAGTPTATGTTATNIVLTSTSSSPYGFMFNPAGTICYVADDASISGGGGIQKYIKSGSTWSFAYTLGTGTGSTVGARSVIADFSGANPIVYATTAEVSGTNRIIKITDTGTSSAAATIVTSVTNTFFRSLAFAPFCPTPVITALTATNGSCGTALNLSATATGTATLAYAWAGAGTFTGGTTATPSVAGAATGTYTVTVTAGCGTTATSTVAVTISATPTVTTTTLNPACNATTADLSTVVTTSGTIVDYYSDATLMNTIANPVALTTSVATYYVQVTNGTCTNSAAITVNALRNDAVAPTTSADFTTVTCTNPTATLMPNGGIYSWGTTNVVTPTVNTTYTVTATPLNGCASAVGTFQLVVDKDAAVAPTTSADFTTVTCTNPTATLMPNGGIYSWGTTNVVTPTTNTTYTVTATPLNGCASAVGTISLVANKTLPTVTVTANPGTTFAAGTLVQFTAAGTGTAWQWTVNGAPVGTNAATYTTDALVTGDAVRCSVTGANGCTAIAAATTVTTGASATAAGNIVVERLGAGGKVLSANGNPIFFDQFTPSGGVATSLSVDSTGTNALIEAGNSTSVGLFTRSVDRKYLVTSGYAVPLPNTTGLAAATATAINRGIVQVDANGTVLRVATSNSFYSANNIRSAVSDGAGNYWAGGAGTNGGTNYFGTASAASNVSTTVTNTRATNIFNGKLYFSTGSGTIGIYQVGTGLPTTSGQTSTLVFASAGGTGTFSPYAFAFNATDDVCYVADDRTAANGGGIQKYTKTAGVWSRTYTLTTGATSTVGARGLTVDFSGANPILYATTSETAANRLIKITDAGSTSGASATLISTAGTNKIYRGVSFAPEAVTPTIVVNTSGFNGNFGNQNTNTVSAPPRTFTVTGSNLTDPITLTVPAGFVFGTTAGSLSTTPITLTATSGAVATTTIYVAFAPTTAGAASGNIAVSSIGAVTQNVAVSGNGTAPAVPTQLVVTAISPASPFVNAPFSATIQAQDASGNSQNVTTATTVSLTLLTGTGALAGTLTGVIAAGTNNVVITGITYTVAETGVSLTATATAGDPLTAAASSTFTVLPVATQLAFVGTPTSGYVATNVATFTVAAQLPNNTVDVNYSGAITISVATGAGSVAGTLTATAINGVATFNAVQFSAVGVYTLNANATGLTQATSGNINITALPTLTEIILPQYAITGTVVGDRLQNISRLKLDNLLPNATYRYSVGASTSNSITTATAPGNFFGINNGAGSAGNIVGYTSQKGFTGALLDNNEFNITAGANRYASFTTDAIGSYTGWFSFVSTGNAVFTAGNDVYVYIQLNNGGTGTSIVQSLRTTNTMRMLGAATGRSVKGSSNATAENAIYLYDNVAGTGRPLYGSWVEDDGINEADFTTWYTSVNGAAGKWGAYVPSALANGIRRVEARQITDGTVVGCPAIDADGVWTDAGNTVNPTAGTASPLVFSVVDAPLTPSYTFTGSAGSNGTVSANGVFTVACGTNLIINITPNTCYAISDVLVDGVSVGAVSSYTFTNFVANHTLAASFALIPYTATGSNPTLACGVSSYDLSAAITAVLPTTFVYYDNAGLTTTVTNPVTTNGTYYVVVENACGATASASVVVAFKANPTAAITTAGGATELTCSLTSIDLTATGGNTYAWSTPTTGATTTATAAGTYTVTATAANSCTATATQAITAVCDEVYQPTTLDVCNNGAGYAANVSGNSFVLIRNANGRVVAAINPQGQNLGAVTINTQNYTAVPNDGTNFYLPRYFDIVPATQPTTPVLVRLYYTNADLTATNAANPALDYAFSELYMTHYSSGADCDVSNNTVGGFDVINPTDVTSSTYGTASFYLQASFTSFSEFGSKQSGAPLPVELLSFTGYTKNDTNELMWVTASEKNSAYFEVQRSTDGVAFAAIGKVQAAGNSSTNRSYNYEDKAVTRNSIYYYRLKMIDQDQSFEYSKVVSLGEAKTNFDNLVLYPNPVRNSLTLTFGSTAQGSTIIDVIDMLGRKVSSTVFATQQGLNPLTIATDGLQNGAYLVRLTAANGNTVVRKFVKVD